MDLMNGRLVVVPALQLDEVLDLAARAADRLEAQEPALASALRGAVSQVRVVGLMEP